MNKILLEIIPVIIKSMLSKFKRKPKHELDKTPLEKLETLIKLNEEIESKLNHTTMLMADTPMVKELGLSKDTLKQMVEWNTNLNFCHSSLFDEIKLLWQNRDRKVEE